MRVLLLAVLLSATGPIGESGGESIRCSPPAQTGCGDRQARERRHSTSLLVDCLGKGALPAIGIRGSACASSAARSPTAASRAAWYNSSICWKRSGS
jgi:hypothetical protein